MGFKPEKNNFFGFAPDRQWLGFMQYVSEKPLAKLFALKTELSKVQIVCSGIRWRNQDRGRSDEAVFGEGFVRHRRRHKWCGHHFPIRYAMRAINSAAGQSAGGGHADSSGSNRTRGGGVMLGSDDGQPMVHPQV